MADPRLEAVPHGSKMSPLMYAKSRTKSGRKVNACPFGCKEQQLDSQGYCRHLVGFTVPGDDKYYYPQKMGPGGKRIVSPKTVVDEDLSADGEEPILKTVAEPVQEGDLLVLITSCHRVYRNVPAPVKDKKKLQPA